MRPFGRVLISIALVACSSRTPGERERALERIPGKSQVIAAADGTALANPTFRHVLDAVRPHVPATLGCVIDAATTSEAIAVGIHPDVGTTIVLVTRAVVARCPALSKIADRVWTATIGAGELAASRADSVLADARWDRARPYLVRDPFALGVELPGLRAIAVAQPEPLDAWLAIDSTTSVETEAVVRAALARYLAPGTVQLSGKLIVDRKGTQVSVHANGLEVEELTTIIVDLLKTSESEPASRDVFTCPPPGNGIISCHDGTHYKVTSVAELVRELGTVEASPVVAGGDIIGIRLIGDPPRLLRRDDVILGLDGHRIADASQLVHLAPTLDGHAALAIRRDGIESVIDLSE